MSSLLISFWTVKVWVFFYSGGGDFQKGLWVIFMPFCVQHTRDFFHFENNHMDVFTSCGSVMYQ